jgi:hypothetical protein
MVAEDKYRSFSEIWDERATIRSRPRRVIESDGLSYFPAARQPLCGHPLIDAADESVRNFVLLQSFYKYMHDIIVFETEIVSDVALRIAKGKFAYQFPYGCRQDAMSVVVDEAYHAYVAMDYMRQAEVDTRISPIAPEGEIELSRAIPRAMRAVGDQLRDAIQLIAVAVAENTVTADVAAFSGDATLKNSVRGIMADHLADEGRHSQFWVNIVRMFWDALEEPGKRCVGAALPGFLANYLTADIQAAYDRRLVERLDLSEAKKSEIAADIVSSYPIASKHPMIGNIRKFLQRTQIADHAPTRSELAEYL